MRNKESIEKFLKTINNNYPIKDLPHEIYMKALEKIEYTYKYMIKRIITKNEYINEMNPPLFNNLIYTMFEEKYMNYRDFFYNKKLKIEWEDLFITKFFASLTCKSYSAGMPIVNRGEIVEHLYLIEQGAVVVAAHTSGAVLAYIPQHGFFGDYQILLNTCSNTSFIASLDDQVVCLTIHKNDFLDLCRTYPSSRQFFIERALASRKLYKRL